MKPITSSCLPVDLSLFARTQHSPSLASLRRGAGVSGRAIVDYCIPINPYFPTAAMLDRLRDSLEDVLKYYPTGSDDIGASLAGVVGIPEANLVLGNGSTELITWIDHLFVTESIVVPIPTFGRWTDQPTETGKRVVHFPRRAEDDFRLDPDELVAFVKRSRARTAVVCNPNNPTGAALDARDVVRLLDGLSTLDLVVIDESFIDFVDEHNTPSVVEEAMRRSNVIVLKSIGKNFGLHGIRAGYAVASAPLAERLGRALPRWNVNGVAEWFIHELGSHAAEYEASRRRCIRDRVALEAALRTIPGLQVFASRANFVYVRLDDAVDGTGLRDRLLVQGGLLLRGCGNKIGASAQHFRIASRPLREMKMLVSHLPEAMRACGYESVA